MRTWNASTPRPTIVFEHSEENLEGFGEEPAPSSNPTVEILPNTQLQIDPAADLLVAGLSDLATAAPTLAGFGDPKYTQCLNQALLNGGLGLAFAETWIQNGGDTAALHCLAYAHQSRGAYDLAGKQFEIVGARIRTYNSAFAATVSAAAGAAYGSEATKLALEAQGSGGGEATRAITERAIDALERAFDHYDTSLLLDPREATTPTDYALLLSDFGYNDEAIALLDQALSLEPSFPPALFTKGLILKQQGEIDAAQSFFQALIRQNPNTPYAHEATKELEGMKPDTL